MGNETSSLDKESLNSTIYMLKILVVGGEKVGKSALIRRFMDNTFNGAEESVNDVYTKEIIHDSISSAIVLNVFEASSDQTVRERQIQNCDGFILTYSLTDKNSLEAIDPLLAELTTMKNDLGIPYIVVGTKSDSNERVITAEEVEEYAKSRRFVETSAKNNVNVEEVFHELTKQIVVSKSSSNAKAPG